MSVLATVAVPATEFPLGSLFDLEGDLTVSVETMVPTSEAVIPYLWVPTDVAASVVDRLADTPSIAAASVIDEVDDNTLVRVEWAGRINGVLASIRESDAILRGAVGTDDRWTFRLRFPSYEALSSFYTACTSRGVSLELVQLHEAVDGDANRRFGLTPAQRDLVVAAYEAGYFDVPRKTTLVELGDRLGVSDSAVSQRLRRGLATLIDTTLIADSQPAEPDAPRLEAEADATLEADDDTGA
ncbi:helix-turn-helix domain-containing protein [Halopiger djelfimassiliensis]|uniref:helix-turn-helix domain-containing protein n=1 Tax=Halopiger djelfimassiliensis TaxID=1293047 RepID=UPI000677D136|nr:bacterio-opsin activator domain-containing protein [Halopiger djelfimassiliensis]